MHAFCLAVALDIIAGMEDAIDMNSGFRISEFVVPILAVAYAAFCIWLVVRIVNRRERCAKWTGLVVICLPLLYVAGFDSFQASSILPA